jgi:hypothetical protein
MWVTPADASAMIPPFIEEAGTDLVPSWLGEDGSMAVWALTRLEVVSAIERRARGTSESEPAGVDARYVREMIKAAHELSDVLAA